MSEARDAHPGTRDGGSATSISPDHSLVTEAVLTTAVDIIRNEGDGCVVDLITLLEELSDKVERFRVTPELSELLVLIQALWDHPHIDQPERCWIEFAWNAENSDPGHSSALTAMLLPHDTASSGTPEPGSGAAHSVDIRCPQC